MAARPDNGKSISIFFVPVFFRLINPNTIEAALKRLVNKRWLKSDLPQVTVDSILVGEKKRKRRADAGGVIRVCRSRCEEAHFNWSTMQSKFNEPSDFNRFGLRGLTTCFGNSPIQNMPAMQIAGLLWRGWKVKSATNPPASPAPV